MCSLCSFCRIKSLLVRQMVNPRRSKKPRSCGAGNVWHPILDECMTLKQYMDYEKFYGANSKARKKLSSRPQPSSPPSQPSSAVDVPDPSTAIQQEVKKKKSTVK